jgi:hypothetical protein
LVSAARQKIMDGEFLSWKKKMVKVLGIKL